MKLFQYLFIAILTFFTWRIFSGEVILIIDNADLIFHEAGHFILIFTGQTLRFLGGTLGQIFFPIVFAFSFLRYRQYYSVTIMLWWLGENLTDIGIYMADARAQILPLIGGEHDWAFLFAKFDLLSYDVMIGKTFWWFGITLMIASLATAVFVTYKQKNEI